MPKYGQTITHKIIGRYGAGHVVLRPASPGTGVIAGGGVRAVLELGGVHDVLTKSHRHPEPDQPRQGDHGRADRLRRPEEVAELRGLTVKQVLGLDLNGASTNGEHLAADSAPAAEEAAPAAEAAPELRPAAEAPPRADAAAAGGMTSPPEEGPAAGGDAGCAEAKS